MNITTNTSDYHHNESSSILDITLHNMSLDISISDMRSMSTNKKNNNNESRMLDLRRVDKIDPMKDLSEDELDAYLLFGEKLRASLSL